MRALWAIVVILSGLVAGGALNNAVAMGPALRTFDERTYLEVQRAFSSLPARFSAFASLAAALLGVALLVFGDLSSTAQALVVAAIALGALLVASIAAAWRMELVARRGEQLPEGHATLRRRWHAAQLTASAVSLAVVACYATAAGPAS